jgi:hypothetical protein
LEAAALDAFRRVSRQLCAFRAKTALGMMVRPAIQHGHLGDGCFFTLNACGEFLGFIFRHLPILPAFCLRCGFKAGFVPAILQNACIL